MASSGRTRSHRQNGVALVTALLVMALATATAVALSSRQHMDIRRTGNVLETDQAYVYALGIESLAEQFLSEYAKQQKYDAEADLAKASVAYPVEGGMVQGHLQDMEGRFNLNSLVDREGKVDQQALQRFQRLLGALNLSFELADAVVDWIDKDSDVRFPGGAEDGDYLGEDTPYRAANRLMASPTELLLVKGFTAEILHGTEEQEGLINHVTALPESSTTINVNTATDKVLQALSDKVTAGVAQQVLEYRKESPFKDVNEFLNLGAIKDLKLKSEESAAMGPLDVQSSYFLVNANVSVARGQMQLSSLLYRRTDGRKVVVIARSQGTSGVY